MDLWLGYSSAERERPIVSAGEPGKAVFLNAANLVKYRGNDLWQAVATTLDDALQVMGESGTVVTSNERLYDQLIAEMNAGISPTPDEIDQIRTIITFFIRQLAAKDVRRLDWVPPAARHLSEWRPGLYLRYGIVELALLENWIFDRAGTSEAIEIVRRAIDDEDFMYAKRRSSHWLDVSDSMASLRAMMTNAGFYLGTSDGDATVADWCAKYEDAIAAADGLFPCPACHPFFFKIHPHIRADIGRTVPQIEFPGPEGFYRMLADRSVCLLTPFAAQIAAAHADGRLFDLYTDLAIPRFDLATVPAFISTYPNRPHGSWSETFAETIALVDACFATRRIDLFFASCGCYGLPICHYVHRRYGVASVYYGNHINTLFGISQKTSESFLPTRRRSENWTPSNLGDVKNMDKIEKGRYT